MTQVALPHRGILVAFEGIDGAGKTTQVALLAERLRGAGLDVVTSKEPRNGLGARLAALPERLPAENELAIFMQDRREHVAELIKPALAAGKVVLIDRYYLSNAAYQGSRGLDAASILAQNEAFAPAPDLMVLLDIPVAVALDRIAARGNGTNSFERAESLSSTSAAFASFNRSYIHRIDGRLPINTIHEAVVDLLDKGPLFRALCFKPYLDECEPEHCGYRLSGDCAYPRLGSLRRRASPRSLFAAQREAQL